MHDDIVNFDNLMGQDVVLHTTDGSFSGKVVELKAQGSVLFDEDNDDIHVVMDDHLVGMTLPYPTADMIKKCQDNINESNGS